MKRFSEKIKQSLNIQSKEWRATSNARNEAMEKEVRRFAQQLKLMHKQLGELDTAIQGGLTTFKAVLLSPLPRAFDEQHIGGVMPMDSSDRLLGVNVDVEGFTGAGAEMHQRLHQEVLVPLEQWLSEYRGAKENNRKCEEIRLDLDNKRRTTMALNEKYQKMRASNHKEADAMLQKVQTEEDKLTRLAQRYAEKEAEVFNAFLRLIRDSAVLRDYAAMGLAILQRCLTAAYTAFDLTTPMPLPLLPAPAPLGPQGLTDSMISGTVQPESPPRLQAPLRVPHTQLSGSPTGTSLLRTVTSRPATTSSGGIPVTMPPLAITGGSAAGYPAAQVTGGGSSGGFAAASLPHNAYGRAPSPNASDAGAHAAGLQARTMPHSTGQLSSHNSAAVVEYVMPVSQPASGHASAGNTGVSYGGASAGNTGGVAGPVPVIVNSVNVQRQSSFNGPSSQGSSQAGYFTNPNPPAVAAPLPASHKPALATVVTQPQAVGGPATPPAWYTDVYSKSRPGFDSETEGHDPANPFESQRNSGNSGNSGGAATVTATTVATTVATAAPAQDAHGNPFHSNSTSNDGRAVYA